MRRSPGSPVQNRKTRRIKSWYLEFDLVKTDKQLFKIFEAVPEWLFELTGLPSPGSSTLQSFTVKALERRPDGVVVPEAPDQPLTIVEFQFQAAWRRDFWLFLPRGMGRSQRQSGRKSRNSLQPKRNA